MRLPARRGTFRTRLRAAHKGTRRSKNLIDLRTRTGTTRQAQGRANLRRR